jgi:hypothetical protein
VLVIDCRRDALVLVTDEPEQIAKKMAAAKFYWLDKERIGDAPWWKLRASLESSGGKRSRVHSTGISVMLADLTRVALKLDLASPDDADALYQYIVKLGRRPVADFFDASPEAMWSKRLWSKACRKVMRLLLEINVPSHIDPDHSRAVINFFMDGKRYRLRVVAATVEPKAEGAAEDDDEAEGAGAGAAEDAGEAEGGARRALFNLKCEVSKGDLHPLNLRGIHFLALVAPPRGGDVEEPRLLLVGTGHNRIKAPPGEELYAGGGQRRRSLRGGQGQRLPGRAGHARSHRSARRTTS